MGIVRNSRFMSDRAKTQFKSAADYWLYFIIGSLGAAMAVTDWKDPRAWIGIAYAGFLALKAKRSGNGSSEGNGSSVSGKK